MKTENIIYFVTGGASGLGLASAELLLQKGARVAILDIAPVEKGQQVLASLLAKHSGEGLYARCDVTSEEQVKDAIAAVDAKWGERAVVGGVIHCGGVGTAGKTLDNSGNPAPLGDFQRVININLVGSFNVARLVASRIVRTVTKPDKRNPILEDNGVIIFTSSISYQDGQMGQAGYASSKAGVAGLTLPMARDLARWGIRVMTIAPSLFETSMGGSITPATKASLLQASLFPPRFGQASEFAHLAHAFIENPMMNGSVVRLDGGMRMSKF